MRQKERQRRPHATPRAVAPSAAPAGYGWLSCLALALSAIVVIARLLMLEALRNALSVAPGSTPVPLGPGPTAGLVLDHLACVPALLALVRRLLDPTFTLRPKLSFVPLLLLGTWALLSTLWAGDKFAAIVSACHLFAAFALLWSTAQLVRGWLHLRLLAGLCFGLLLVLVAQGLVHRAVDQPALEQEWMKNRDEILRQRELAPGSFEAGQFENKVLHGELMGFSASPNTHAAVLVLLGAVAMGVMAQRLTERNFIGAGVVAVGIVLGIFTIYFTQSRTAYLTTVLALLAMLALWPLRPFLARHATKFYWAGVLAIALGSAAVVGHGLRHGTLFHDSLNFRWRYWVGAYGVFRLHPLLGVGWENFGPHYLAARLPTATEEIKDPHNFLVRFFVELGLVGGLLALAWMLRMAWEMTRSITPADPAPPAPAAGRSHRIGGLVAFAATAGAGVFVNALASIDFAQESAFVTIESLRRVLYLVALLIGIASVSLRAGDQSGAVELDARPAPWALYGLLLGLGLFLLHNTIDFALFETGPLFAFALLSGAALGLRTPKREAVEPLPRRQRLTGLGAALGAAAWVVGLDFLIAPVASAEASAQEADRALGGLRVPAGAKLLEEAYATMPSNGDYAFRAAQAYRAAGRVDRARAMLDAAVAASPQSAGYRASRATFEQEQPKPDVGRVRADYAAALALDPNNVILRIRFGDALETFGLRPEAAEQYERALWYNDQLTKAEKKRLAEAKVRELREKIAALRGTPTTLPA